MEPGLETKHYLSGNIAHPAGVPCTEEKLTTVCGSRRDNAIHSQVYGMTILLVKRIMGQDRPAKAPTRCVSFYHVYHLHS